MPAAQKDWRRRGLVLAFLLTFLVAAIATAAVVRVDVGAPEPLPIPPLRAGTTGSYAFYDAQTAIGALAFEIRGVDPVVAQDGSKMRGYQVRVNATAGPHEQHHTEWLRPDGSMVRYDTGEVRPGFEEVRAYFLDSEPLIPHLGVGGETLHGGTYFHDEETLWSWWSLEEDRPVLDRVRCAVTASHVVPGLIDHIEARGIETTLSCADSLRTRTTWFTADRAVPQVVTYGETGKVPLMMALTSYRHGDGPEVTGDVGVASEVPPLRHGPAGVQHPVSGGALLPYPIESAIEDATGSAGPALFRIWSARHPDAELVGARLMRGEHHVRDAPTDQWRFLYADPAGEAYLVHAERARDGAEAWVTDGGEWQVDQATGGGRPIQLITLETAAERWNRLAGPDHQGLEPDFVHWGLDVPLVWSGDCGFVPPQTALLPLETRFDRIVVGHSTYGSCTDPKVVRSESYVVLDAASAEARQLVEHQVEMAAFPEGDVSRAAPSSIVTGVSAITVRPPDVEPLAATVPFLVLIWAAYFWPNLKVFFLSAYSRVLPSEVPDHPVRARLLRLVREDEGVTASELTARMGIGWGAFTHHTALLERAGHLTSCVVGRNRHLFTSSTARRGPIRALALMRHPAAQKALDAIAARPGLTQQELAERLEMTPAGALWHARRLEEAGLIRRERAGRYVVYHPVAAE